MKTALLLMAVGAAGFLAGVIWSALGRISKEADRDPADDQFEDIF